MVVSLSHLSNKPSEDYRLDSSRINTLLLNIDGSLFPRDFYKNHDVNVNYIVNIYDYIKSQILFFLLKDYYDDRSIETYKNSNDFISYCKKGRTSFLKVYGYFLDDMITVQFNLLTVEKSLINIIPSVPSSIILEDYKINSLSELIEQSEKKSISLMLVDKKVIQEYKEYLFDNLNKKDELYANIMWLMAGLRMESLKVKAEDILYCLKHENEEVVNCVVKTLLYCLSRRLDLPICIDERRNS